AGVGEAREDAVRRFEDDDRMAERGERAVERPALAGAEGREPGEGERVGRKARGDERGEDRGSARDRLDRDAAGRGFADEEEARVGEEGRAGVARESDRGAPLEIVEEAREALAFVVLVERDELLADAEMGEETPGDPCVLAGDQVRALERLARAEREIAEVADRRRDHQQPPRRRASFFGHPGRMLACRPCRARAVISAAGSLFRSPSSRRPGPSRGRLRPCRPASRQAVSAWSIASSRWWTKIRSSPPTSTA